MRRPVFLRIMNAVEEHDDYFVQKRNAAGQLGLSCLQKVVAAFRMLAYGVPADALDEYIRIGESTALEALRKFVVAVVEVFGPEYLRMPNEQDTARLLATGASRGFLGMLGSILQKVEDRDLIADACRSLEVTAMDIFARNGWQFSNRLCGL